LSVEATAAALAARRASAADIDELTARNAAITRALAVDDFPTVVRADEASLLEWLERLRKKKADADVEMLGLLDEP
jgi:DNA-binding GntR family transcriptional regulator